MKNAGFKNGCFLPARGPSDKESDSKTASESNIELFSFLASVKLIYLEEIQPGECFVVKFTTVEDDHAKHYIRELLELEQHEGILIRKIYISIE